MGTKGLVNCSVAAADIAFPGTITSAKLAGSIALLQVIKFTAVTVNG